MPEGVLLDNDVVLKACAYRCHVEVVAATTANETPPSILGIARFTLGTRLSRLGHLRDPEGAAVALQELLGQVALLQPTEDEIVLAANLEERATALSLDFDTGESQLVAILLSRGCPLLVTGDKRAIAAMSGIASSETEGRIACLEQLVVALLTKHSMEVIRRGVCAEPAADKAVTACFACAAEIVSPDDVRAGLTSYINHLRRIADPVLADDASLLTIAS